MDIMVVREEAIKRGAEGMCYDAGPVLACTNCRNIIATTIEDLVPDRLAAIRKVNKEIAAIEEKLLEYMTSTIVVFIDMGDESNGETTV